MKEIYEIKGAGYSIRDIARELDIAPNTVRRYLQDPEAVMPKPRRRSASKLDPFIEYMDLRLLEGLENCVVLSRELQGLGYQGGYSLVKAYVSPRRRRRQVQATVRFETEPGEQAKVDWGSFSYVDESGRKRRMWAFVMVLSWSRAIYVEFVRRADTASFIQCHVNAFDYLGGVPRRCLYDNAKVVTLGRDEEGHTEWNRRTLDFALRLGFDLKLCQPYRAQTKGKVASGVKYVRGNLWPSVRFTDDADLNRQAAEWCTTVANQRLHGTTHRLPAEMLAEEQPHGVSAHLTIFSLICFTDTHPAGAAAQAPDVSADQGAASLTHSLASRIRPIMAMSTAPRLRALAARSSRPPLPGRGSCAVFHMAR